VFTNGCFDVFHYGHLHVLREARKYGSKLIVGINSDESVKRLKGSSRPIFPFKYRSEIVSSLIYVDGIIKFEDDTPLDIIKRIKPNVLVKGGDWKEEEIVGADFVKSMGGTIKTVPYLEKLSSTNIIEYYEKRKSL
jgi:D-beta-D-heptose 7-phosphate kinase/D-beta-D-heptose 1-phosphate adenosyltransferase